MLDRLPVHINPLSFAERGKRLFGTIEISELTRLSDLLIDNSGTVDVDLSFDKDGRVPIIQGEIKANLMLECQACLGPVVLEIERSVKLGLVTSLEQADRLASDCEPFMLENEKILLNILVEDELLLAIPDFPRHKGECVKRDVDENSVIVDDSKQLNSNNPFSVLAKLKNTGD